jgi:hypothetical protein
MRGGRAIKAQFVVRLRQTPTRFVLMVRRFTETPYSLDRSMLLQQFCDLNGVQRRAFE